MHWGQGANFLKGKKVVEMLQGNLLEAQEMLEEQATGKVLTEIKSIMWCFGHLGSQQHGQQLLSDDVVAQLCQFADACQVRLLTQCTCTSPTRSANRWQASEAPAFMR